MLAKQQDEWILISQPEPFKWPVISFVARPDAELRRQCFSLFFLVLTVATIFVVQTERLAQTGYELVRLRGFAAELEKQNQTLRIDVARLKSPERIETIATQQLGLVVLDGENL